MYVLFLVIIRFLSDRILISCLFLFIVNMIYIVLVLGVCFFMWINVFLIGVVDFKEINFVVIILLVVFFL